MSLYLAPPMIASTLLLSMLSSTSSVAASFAFITQRQPKRSLPRRRTFATSTISMSSLQPDTSHPYHPPSWAANILTNVPQNGRLHLANLPTPIHLIGTSSNSRNNSSSIILARLNELNIKLYIKRDDATHGTECGGNKIRKLEFLLSDALVTNCDAVVTIGGEQSNHCRATAAAARMVGIDPHLILRTSRRRGADDDGIHDEKKKDEKEREDMGYTGNILFDRMVGSTIYTCTPGEVSIYICLCITAIYSLYKFCIC